MVSCLNRARPLAVPPRALPLPSLCFLARRPPTRFTSGSCCCERPGSQLASEESHARARLMPHALPPATAQVAGYKVKVMLAEPKTRRGAVGGGSFMPALMAGKAGLSPSLLSGMGMAGQGYIGGAGSPLISSLSTAGLMSQGWVLPGVVGGLLGGAVAARSTQAALRVGWPGLGVGPHSGLQLAMHAATLTAD
jgi:hypothetical protein